VGYAFRKDFLKQEILMKISLLALGVTVILHFYWGMETGDGFYPGRE